MKDLMICVAVAVAGVFGHLMLGVAPAFLMAG